MNRVKEEVIVLKIDKDNVKKEIEILNNEKEFFFCKFDKFE